MGFCGINRLLCVFISLRNTQRHTHEWMDKGGWSIRWVGGCGESQSGPAHSEKRHTAACTVVFIQSYAILPSVPDVELLLLCVDAPRVVEPRKALGRSRWSHIFSQTIFVRRLFKVITGRAWDTQWTKDTTIRVIHRPAGGLWEITARCHVGSVCGNLAFQHNATSLPAHRTKWRVCATAML